MKFAFKINSSYDGFNPGVIEDRMFRGRLTLGWKRYIEAVEIDDEVWIHFRGPDRYVDGVYAECTVREIDLEAREVVVRVERYSTEEPLTNQAISEAVARVVATPYRQVFYLPDDLLRVFDCDINGDASSCARRRCSQCVAWPALPRVEDAELALPSRLEGSRLSGFAPAYWVIARRSWASGRNVRAGIRDTSFVFKQFKTGAKELAYPLARGIAEVLRDRDLQEADFIVPIPLSPDKATAGELHRTLALPTSCPSSWGSRCGNPWTSTGRSQSGRSVSRPRLSSDAMRRRSAAGGCGRSLVGCCWSTMSAPTAAH